jgi:hypothetical protein
MTIFQVKKEEWHTLKILPQLLIFLGGILGFIAVLTALIEKLSR